MHFVKQGKVKRQQQIREQEIFQLLTNIDLNFAA